MKPHEEWLFRAKHDIDSAVYLLSSPNPLYDIAVYHTQQCAEKSLKAFLSFHLLPVTKTHNLTMLVKSCAEVDLTFESLLDDCIFLAPFATLYRYPDGDLMPGRVEVNGSFGYWYYKTGTVSFYDDRVDGWEEK